MKKTTELPGFERLDMKERRERAADVAGVSVEELATLGSGNGLADSKADRMVENAVGVMSLPLGLCVNMRVDGRDRLVPMAVEAPGVVAASSYAAKLLRAGGGVVTTVAPPHMLGQVQLLDVLDFAKAERSVEAARAEIVALANSGHEALVSQGGGAVELTWKKLAPIDAADPVGPMLVVEIVVDVRDAVGDDAVNAMCERIAPRLAQLTGGRAGVRVVSNLAERRVVEAVGRVPLSALEPDAARGIVEACVFAERDPYRAASHNKGIMNGIDAALIALGQDFRAVEAGAHAYACRSGKYAPLATWRVEGDELVGRMTVPMVVGAVGQAALANPTVRANCKLCGIESSSELASTVAAVGLAQNLASLRGLATEGIQRELSGLRLRSLALEAGAAQCEVESICAKLAGRATVTVGEARDAVEALRAAPVVEVAETESMPPPSAVSRSSQSAASLKEDRAFCETTLPGVSRTFALSIQALPADLREAIGVAYLLCRVVDTVEDDRRQDPAVRGALFDAFDRALAASAQGDGSLATAFEDGSRDAGLGVTESEKTLCTRAGCVFRTFASLPDDQRAAIEPSVAEMSKGMRAYSERADQEGGLKLRDVEDLEKYCYYVAGTVGELLTALFRLSFPVTASTRTELEARAVSFGLGLQLVNILKDVAEDAVRGDCFLPQKQAAELGLTLSEILAPSERSKGLALLRALSARARHHLERAEEYTILWPTSAGEIRLFCTVPLALALATLREVELGDDALMPNRAPTVSRALVMKVFEDAVNATRTIEDKRESDRALRQLFDRSRTGIIGRPARPSTIPAPGTAPPSSQRPSRPAPGNATASGAGIQTVESSKGSPMSETTSSRVHGLQPRREFGGKVLVTGGAGHVGANLVHRLLTEGRDVRVFLRPSSDNSAVDAIEAATGKKVERVFGDLRSPREVATAVRGCESIFHVAARVSTLSEKPQDLRDLYACNVIGTANLLRAAGDAGVKRTVVTGSLSAVGFDIDDPSKPSDESMPFYPFSEHLPYGRTKSLVEHEVLKACVEGVDALVATSCAVLGPWDYKPSRMGRTLIDFATGKLAAYLPGGFDFVATRDLVDGHILAMERGRTGQRYIISTEFATVDQLMEIFEETTGRPRPKLRLPPGVMKGVAHVTSFVMSTFFPTKPQRFTPHAVRLLGMQRKADTTKAQVELGYKPTTIRTAIHEAYADFARRGLVPQSPTLAKNETAASLSEAKPASKNAQEGAAA